MEVNLNICEISKKKQDVEKMWRDENTHMFSQASTESTMQIKVSFRYLGYLDIRYLDSKGHALDVANTGVNPKHHTVS